MLVLKRLLERPRAGWDALKGTGKKPAPVFDWQWPAIAVTILRMVLKQLDSRPDVWYISIVKSETYHISEGFS